MESMESMDGSVCSRRRRAINDIKGAKTTLFPASQGEKELCKVHLSVSCRKEGTKKVMTMTRAGWLALFVGTSHFGVRPGKHISG